MRRSRHRSLNCKFVITSLLARITELERRLGLNCGNSGKPPSSDGLKKPPRTQSLRKPSGNKSGRQKGHPGKTLRQIENPDVIIDHFPRTGAGCGGALNEATAEGFSARQVFDLPKPQPLAVTEHRAHHCHCMSCGKQTRAAFPDCVTAPVRYGQRIGGKTQWLHIASTLGIIRTLISTARKQKWHLLKALTGDPVSLIAELRLA